MYLLTYIIITHILKLLIDLIGRYARVVDNLAVRDVAQGAPLGGDPHTIKVLEHAQNQALRLITGAVKTTPIDAMTFIMGNKPIQ